MDLAFGAGEKKRKTGPSKKWTEKMIKDELNKFDEKIKESKEREGDTEVRDHIYDKGVFLRDEA